MAVTTGCAISLHGGSVGAPWLLAEAWTDAALIVVDTGHPGGKQMTTATVGATDRFVRDRA
jgi:hypothetical protein